MESAASIANKSHPEIAALVERLKPMKFADFMAQKLPPLEWFIERLVPEEGTVAIIGHPGSNKSWLGLLMAKSIATGELFLGKFKTKRASVLYIDEEMGARQLYDRLTLLGWNGDLDVYLNSLGEFKLETQKVDHIIRFCLRHKIRVVVMDALIRLHGLDENWSKDMSAINEQLKQFKIKGITVIYLHHLRKTNGKQKNSHSGQEMRGSGDLMGYLDIQLMINVGEDKKTITIEQTKCRLAEQLDPFDIKINQQSDHLSFVYHGADVTVREKEKKLQNQILAVVPLGKEILQRDFLRKLKEASVARRVAKAKIKALVASGLLAERRGEKRALLYSLPDPTKKQSTIVDGRFGHSKGKEK